MTDDQRQRIHDIEYSCDSRAELAERIVGLENENAVLTIKHNAEHIIRQNVEADNAKLREELEQWEHMMAGIELPDYPITQFQPKDLERENAKLRELMSVMAYCNQFKRDCDGCSMNGADGIITERAGCDELLTCLRKFGVEVDRWRA